MTIQKEFLYVIILYRRALDETATFKSLIERFPDVQLFVYDNSPCSQQVNRCCTKYVHDPQNHGLSVAYNTAAKFAREEGFEWIVLLDQDTNFLNISIDDYKDAIANHSEIKMFAPKVRCGNKYMSPVKVWQHMAVLQESVPSGIIPLRKYTPINSGLCVNVDAMMECGGYNEAVFLDYSDHEFIRRFRKFYSNAFIIDKEIHQNFSVVSDDRESTINRYGLYCRSIRECERVGVSDRFWFFVLVLKRGLSICVKQRTIQPFKILWKEYL